MGEDDQVRGSAEGLGAVEASKHPRVLGSSLIGRLRVCAGPIHASTLVALMELRLSLAIAVLLSSSTTGLSRVC